MQTETWPIESLEPLDEVAVLPLSDPRIIGGVTDETIKAIRRNHHRLYIWGLKNRNTLHMINQGQP